MEILLINPPVREHCPPAMFPLGMAYVARVLGDAGHKVRVIDADGERISREEVLKRVKKSSFDVVGTGGLITTYRYVKWLAKELKDAYPDVPVVVGGSLATSVPELVLENIPADVCVLGEGEETAKELASALEEGSDLSKVNGLCYKEDGAKKYTEHRKLIEPLDSIPFPAWDLFPVEKYLRIPGNASGFKKKMNVSTIRACPFRCTYCYHIFGYVPRYRSAQNILEEIRVLKEKYGVEFIVFSDDLFVANRKRVLEFCNLLKKEKLGVEWSSSMRVNVVDPELLKEMRSAGCVWASFGIESGSQKILNELNKGVTVEQAEKGIRMAREAGIKVDASFMMGAPGETRETVEETIEFCKRNDFYVTFFLVTPYPGTPLYEQVKHKVKNLDEWVSDLDDATKFTINLTSMSDGELLALKKEAEKRTRENYLGNHPFRKVFYELLRKQGVDAFKVFGYYDRNGLANLLKRGVLHFAYGKNVYLKKQKAIAAG